VRFITDHDPGWSAWGEDARAQVFDVPPREEPGAYDSARALGAR
jgi:hypothetical protein